jgi:DNA-binding CsgD family transcriptional regulator
VWPPPHPGEVRSRRRRRAPQHLGDRPHSRRSSPDRTEPEVVVDRTVGARQFEAASRSEIAPLVIEAYDLSEREREITRLIARGAATAEIASQLFLSPHTVRDHIKTIFGKVGVSSRGELVARLYAEFYEPAHLYVPPHTGTTG